MRGSEENRSLKAGQLFFSMMNHRMYDTGLYRFVTGQIWRCPTERLMDTYADNISGDHLEIGVGSGYFLEHTLCSESVHRLVLLDLNRSCLEKSAERLKSCAPLLHQLDIQQPIAPAMRGFASIGMNYVLHCIPGNFRRIQHIFHHVHAMLAEDGVFFGATLVKRPARKGVIAWLLMWFLNAVGIFNNSLHTVEELEDAMKSLFDDVEISTVGSAVVFRASKGQR
jgi:hypothetical protein